MDKVELVDYLEQKSYDIEEQMERLFDNLKKSEDEGSHYYYSGCLSILEAEYEELNEFLDRLYAEELLWR